MGNTNVTETNKILTENVGGPNVLTIVGLCVAGGWLIALQNSKNSATDYYKLDFWQLLFDPGFLGMAIAPALVFVVTAAISWALSRLVIRTKAFASWAALIGPAFMFLMLHAGGEIGQSRHLNPSVVSNSVLSAQEETRPKHVSPSMQQQPRSPTGSAVGGTPPTTPPLTSGEQMTINMACGDYQMNGDVSGYRSCMHTQLGKAASAGGSIPSISSLTSGEQLAIGMACADYQMNGDISGYQSCMHSQIELARP